MQKDTRAPARVMLHGTWTMNDASERQQLLAGELTLLLEADPGPDGVGIDLTGVTGIDPCGCQLLALFLENLKLLGIAPHPCGIPPELMEQIRLIGFGDAFAPSGTTGEETA